MNYSTFKDLKISKLGFGSMRLPSMENDISKIDEADLTMMVDYAIKHGVNYFDTAWGYHDGKAAEALGRALSHHPRKSYLLANKFPGYNKELMKNPEMVFEKQLKDCNVEYFDFYLMHDIDDYNVKDYTDLNNSAVRYFIEMKNEGKIRHLGFSTFGSVDTINRFLDTYGDNIEFCQMPLNYMLWAMRKVKRKVEIIKSRGVPIWATEPLDRGKLANISDARKEVLKMMRPDDSVAEWAFRFAQSVTSVKTVISGMSNINHLIENIRIFSEKERGYLNSKEGAVLLGIALDMLEELRTNSRALVEKKCTK
jgi:predicted aldo/keto reductase-like oxidoreductase